jgi:hypothetical protein
MQCGMLYIPLPSDVSHLVPWPTRMAEQTQVATAPPDRVAALLETLVTLGQARQTGAGWFVAG